MHLSTHKQTSHHILHAPNMALALLLARRLHHLLLLVARAAQIKPQIALALAFALFKQHLVRAAGFEELAKPSRENLIAATAAHYVPHLQRAVGLKLLLEILFFPLVEALQTRFSQAQKVTLSSTCVSLRARHTNDESLVVYLIEPALEALV